MSDETTLLSCPFCGGEVRMRRVDFPDGDAEYVFDCACGRKIFETTNKAKAVTAWNTRAELGSGTCEKVYAVGGIIAQAECRDVCSDVEQFTCSACGFNCDLTSWITPIGCDRPIVHHHHGTPNFCPNCGAKVVAR